MSTVLIGVDATARSEDAVALARQLALTFTGDLIVAAITHDHTEGDATVRRMAGLLEPGIEPDRIRTAVLAAPSPAQGLHELAEAEAADLIVVGSTHTGRLGRVRPGSTGERLLQGAPCAVAVAPHGFRTRLDPQLEHDRGRVQRLPRGRLRLADRARPRPRERGPRAGHHRHPARALRHAAVRARRDRRLHARRARRRRRRHRRRDRRPRRPPVGRARRPERSSWTC